MAASKSEDNLQLHKLISKNMLQSPKYAQTWWKPILMMKAIISKNVSMAGKSLNFWGQVWKWITSDLPALWKVIKIPRNDQQMTKEWTPSQIAKGGIG